MKARVSQLVYRWYKWPLGCLKLMLFQPVFGFIKCFSNFLDRHRIPFQSRRHCVPLILFQLQRCAQFISLAVQLFSGYEKALL